jgi:hypothetical protein
MRQSRTLTVISVAAHKDNRYIQKKHKSFHNSGLYQFLYMIVLKYEYSKLVLTPLHYIRSCLSYLAYQNHLLTSTNITTQTPL